MASLTVICTTYGHSKPQLEVTINSLLCQTSPNWKLWIVHDGPNEEVRGWVEAYVDPRIKYWESETRTGFWGHYNRRWLLDFVDTDYVTFSNADNYHSPVYVEWMTQIAEQRNLDILLTPIVHNYPNVNGPGDPPYSVLDARFGLNGVDFMSFIIKTSVLQEVGFNHPEFTGADGMIIEDCKKKFAEQNRELRWDKLRSVLGVHN